MCVLFVAYGRNRLLLLWAAAFGIHSVSYILVAARGYIPDFISIVIANTLIASMIGLYIEGITRFNEKLIHPAIIWSPVAAIFVSYWLFIANFDVRVAIGSVVSALQAAVLLWVVLRGFKERSGRGKWILLAATLLSVAMFIFRGGVAIFGSTAISTMSGLAIVPMVVSVGAMVVLIMFAFGLVVIFKERAEQANLELALKDPLTQLGNRRLLEMELGVALNAHSKGGEIGAVLMLDLDHFKPLNDRYGHGYGDQLLKEVAFRIKESVKADDVVVRLGGDEFVVLVTDLGLEAQEARSKAAVVANRILNEIARPLAFLPFGNEQNYNEPHEFKFSCSIGVALYIDKNSERDSLLKRADQAMYAAKKAGRNRVAFSGE